MLLLFGSSTLTFLLAAVLFQIFYSPPPIISGWRGHVKSLEQNELGYRGHSIAYSDEDFVILLLGDSQVEAQACRFEYLPESRLEHDLNTKGKRVKVFSIGAAGYGQDQQLLALREYFSKYRANLVLLWQTPTNDVWNNIFPTHWPTNANPKPTFWIEDGQLKGPTEQIGETISRPRIKMLSLFGKFIPSISQRDTIWEKRLPTAYKPLTEFKGPVNYDWQQRWDANLGLMRDENLDIEKSHFAIRLTPRSKRMEYGLVLTRKLLHEIDKLIFANNGRFVIFEVTASSEKPTLEEEVHILNGKFYRTSEHQFRENLNYINNGFRTLDILVPLRNWRVGPADSHLNEKATDEAMMNLRPIATIAHGYLFISKKTLFPEN